MIGELTGDVASVRGMDALVTLVEGRSFCLSAASGDMTPSLTQGLFVMDTRALSRWELRVNGHPVEGLSVETDDPFSARFVGRGRPHPGEGDSALVVFRHRLVGRGMSERIAVVNYGASDLPVTIELTADTDFAGIFEVKNGRIEAARAPRSYRTDDGMLELRSDDRSGTKQVRITLSEPAILEPGTITWRRSLPPRERWELCCDVAVGFEGRWLQPLFACGTSEHDTVPSQRLISWRATLPDVRSSSAQLDAAFRQSGEDLGALRIFDPDHPDTPILAAGAPWYMTVFGRDSLLTGWMTLLADHSLAAGVLDTLARFQGDDVVPHTEEQPGKILHEIRLDLSDGITFSHADIYYGTIDATPLFVMLLAEARRWGLDEPTLLRLLPHADRAIEWIEQYGDRDGDGYVEYQRATPDGLANQGWKDSWDGIRFADGRFPQSPIALCEAQGYVHAAYLARAHLADELGDIATRDRCQAKATDLRRRFNEDFWLPERGWYALALDAEKRPIDALASNVGHCLWTGIVDPEHADAVGRCLLSSEMFSGWGVRTLASSMVAYNPVSYHNGSVWPHDNAIVAAGLARYGLVEEAHRVIAAQLEVGTRSGGRLPELFAGFARSEFGSPAAYPSSCSPQAWAAAAPLLWLRTLLRLEPYMPRGELWLAPCLPDWLGELHVQGLALGDQRVSVHVVGDDVEIEGHHDLRVIAKPRVAGGIDSAADRS